MIAGKFLGGTVAVNPQTGAVSMGASVELIDDQLGSVGQRSIPVNDPQVIAQVTAFIEQMLPTLSAAAGFEVTLPEASE